MDVILRQAIENLGNPGDVVTVKPGYARNYLIPQGLAVVATAGELKTASHNQAVKERKIARQENQLQALSDRINGQRLTFVARAGEQGRLYGSVTAGDIAERLSGQVGETIDRRRVQLDEPLRSVGEHTVHVHLVGRLRPEITVIVEGEQVEGTSAAPTDEPEPSSEIAESE